MAAAINVSSAKIPKRFPWLNGKYVPCETNLCPLHVKDMCYYLTDDEIKEQIEKAESFCIRTDYDFAPTLRAICWSAQSLPRLPPKNEVEWKRRIKQIGRIAIKTMRDAGEDPLLYFPNKLPEYERMFAD